MTTAVSEPEVTFQFHGLELLWTLARTDFKTRYHGTIGGLAWALLKPFAMFVVLASVFSFVFSADESYRVNLIIGLFLFDFFGEATRTGITSLYLKGFLLAKARFPSWIVVVASIANPLITLAIVVIVMLVFVTATVGAPSLAHLALFAYYLLLFVTIVVGFSLGTSVLFLIYRDLNQIWDVVVHAGFFIAPVVYPLSIIPERYHLYLYLWPPTPVIEFSRSVLTAGIVPSGLAHLWLTLEAVCVLGIGTAVFKRYAPGAAERL